MNPEYNSCKFHRTDNSKNHKGTLFAVVRNKWIFSKNDVFIQLYCDEKEKNHLQNIWGKKR